MTLPDALEEITEEKLSRWVGMAFEQVCGEPIEVLVGISLHPKVYQAGEKFYGPEWMSDHFIEGNIPDHGQPFWLTRSEWDFSSMV